MASPFPASFDGSGALFGMALASLIIMASLATMLAIILTRHLVADRRMGYDAVAAVRSLVLAVCSVAIMRCVPEVTYMVAYAEAQPATLAIILTVKRTLDVLSLIPVLVWMGTFWVWYPDIVLRLRDPMAIIWADHRLVSLKRFGSIVAMCCALALAITLGRLFH